MSDSATDKAAADKQSNTEAEYTAVGKISGVFGIKGWVKVRSHTEPEENIFEYSPWRVKLGANWVELEVDEAQPHKDVWIAHIKGLDAGRVIIEDHWFAKVLLHEVALVLALQVSTPFFNDVVEFLLLVGF